MASNKRTLIIFAGVVLIGAVFLTWFTQKSGYRDLHPLRLHGETIYVSIADTDAERSLGLGGRTGLKPDEGMLFVFSTEGQYAFWMKDMKFSIDILWLDRNGTVVYVAPAVSPDTYPRTFVSDNPALYVLELPAGYANLHGVQVGDKISI